MYGFLKCIYTPPCNLGMFLTNRRYIKHISFSLLNRDTIHRMTMTTLWIDYSYELFLFVRVSLDKLLLHCFVCTPTDQVHIRVSEHWGLSVRKRCPTLTINNYVVNNV